MMSVSVLGSCGLYGQSVALPKFEVASVRPHPDRALVLGGAVTGPQRFVRESATVKYLITWAYDLERYRVIGGPEWIQSENYDIVAKSAGPADAKQMKLMVQSLLADRFQVKAHREVRELSVYGLELGRNGLKVQAVPAPESENPTRMLGIGSDIRSRAASLAELAQLLTNMLDRPVLDKTGIDGRFTYDLGFDPAILRGGSNLADDSEPSIFTAVQEQLGLKLEPQKAPIEVLVIDQIERPSEN